VIAQAVGLLTAAAGPGQRDRVGRRLECIGVPLEDVARRPFKVAEQPVCVRMRSRVEPVPADLGHGVGPYVAAHGLGEQLAPETDAEHGFVRRHGFADRVQLGPQVREPVGLVDVHRAAQHYESVVATDVRLRGRFAAEVDVTDAEAGRPEQRIEVAERLGGDVLENEQLGHDRVEEWGGPHRGPWMTQAFWCQSSLSLNSSCSSCSMSGHDRSLPAPAST